MKLNHTRLTKSSWNALSILFKYPTYEHFPTVLTLGLFAKFITSQIEKVEICNILRCNFMRGPYQTRQSFGSSPMLHEGDTGVRNVKCSCGDGGNYGDIKSK